MAVKDCENKIREIINMINVMKEEEVQDVTTKISPTAANNLVAELEKLAELVGEL